VSETAIVADVRLKLSRGDVRLFRNNVGKLQDRNGMWVAYGLAVGSADLIGFKSVEITPDMVGKRVAVFASLEGKAPGKRPTDEQRAWREMISRHGGIAGTFYSVDDARKILNVP
jgi:hypothetical protein